MEVHRDLGNLEVKLGLAMKHLENGKVDLDHCLRLWGTTNVDRAKELCLEEIAEINTRWEATTEPVANAYWSLRQLCFTDYAPALPGRGPTTNSATHTSHRAERAIVSVSVIVMALISAFSAGSAVGFAVQDQVAKKQEERLSIKLDEVKARVDTVNKKLHLPEHARRTGRSRHGHRRAHRQHHGQNSQLLRRQRPNSIGHQGETSDRGNRGYQAESVRTLV